MWSMDSPRRRGAEKNPPTDQMENSLWPSLPHTHTNAQPIRESQKLFYWPQHSKVRSKRRVESFKHSLSQMHIDTAFYETRQCPLNIQRAHQPCLQSCEV